MIAARDFLDHSLTVVALTEPGILGSFHEALVNGIAWTATIMCLASTSRARLKAALRTVDLVLTRRVELKELLTRHVVAIKPAATAILDLFLCV